MVNYDSLPIYLAVRTEVGSGSIHLVVARSLSKDRVCFTFLLIDLWKLGLKDGFGKVSMRKKTFDEMFNAMIEEAEEHELHYHPVDTSEARWLVAQGIRIAKKVSVKPVNKRWIDIVGDISGVKIEGSLYKCYSCERGELQPEGDDFILEVAKREVKIAGTPKEPKIVFLCKECEKRQGNIAAINDTL